MTASPNSLMTLHLNDKAEALLRKSVYAVSATDFEMRTLMKDHVERGIEPVHDGGGMVTIGSVTVDDEELPVTVHVRYGQYKGNLILFYEACSRVVDHDQVRAWLDEQGFFGPPYRCTDATNFIHCLHHIDQMAA